MLVEGSPKLLGVMSEEASKKAREYLEKMGAEIWTGTTVKDYDGKFALLSNGKSIRTDNVIWAAGITANAIEGINPELTQRGNRIKVDRYNRSREKTRGEDCMSRSRASRRRNNAGRSAGIFPRPSRTSRRDC